MDLLREYERLMGRAGFAVAKRESGKLPRGGIPLLSLGDLDDDAIGASTNDFENTIYRAARGLSLRENNCLVFDQSVGYRVFDVDGPCALYVARMHHVDSDSTLEWFMARDGAVPRTVEVAELPFALKESVAGLRCENVEVLAQLVRVFQGIYEACRRE